MFYSSATSLSKSVIILLSMAMEGLLSELFVGFDDFRFCLAVWTFGISRGSKLITVEPRLEHLEPLLELNDARRSIVVPWSELLECVLSSFFKLFVVECVGDPNWFGTQRLSRRPLFCWKLFSDESFLLDFITVLSEYPGGPLVRYPGPGPDLVQSNNQTLTLSDCRQVIP